MLSGSSLEDRNIIAGKDYDAAAVQAGVAAVVLKLSQRNPAPVASWGLIRLERWHGNHEAM